MAAKRKLIAIAAVILFFLINGAVIWWILPEWGDKPDDVIILSSPAGSPEDRSRGRNARSSAENNTQRRDFDLHVVDAQTRQGISGVQLKIHLGGEPSNAVTDAKGSHRIQLPAQEARYFFITAHKEGMSPRQFSWNSDQKIDLPESYTLAMEKGTSVGGIIQDEQGRPIADASVYLHVNDSRGKDDRVSAAVHNFPAKTDKQGRWICDMMPAEFQQVSVRLTHADYISDEHFGQTPAPPVEKLRDKTAVMVMKEGIAIVGRVLDSDGDPVPQARVSRGDFNSNYSQTRSDEKGNFRIGPVNPGETVLVARSRRFSPDMKVIQVDGETPPVEFRLEPGRTLYGRVVDKDGNPIARAYISADSWRGRHALVWGTRTDEDGRFGWIGAPADEFICSISHEGYMALNNCKLIASEQEMVFTLYPSLIVKGTVVDAETGKPIDKIRVIQGIQFEEDSHLAWQNHDVKTFADGRYEMSFTSPESGHAFRMEADGYLPIVSPIYRNDQGEVAFDVKMKKGTGPAGIVLDLDGKPLAGVEVGMATEGDNPIMIQDGKIQRNGRNIIVVTGPDGRFVFQPQIDSYTLVVVNEHGFGRVTGEQLNASPEIKLQPWGRVEGTLRIGSKPGAAQELMCQSNSNQVYYSLSTTADDKGGFVFPRMLPGPVSLSRVKRTDSGSAYFAQVATLTVKAGETSTIVAGGVGRPLIGRVITPPDSKIKLLKNSHVSINTDNSVALFPYPDEWLDMNEGQQQTWVKTWRKSQEGQSWQSQNQNRQYSTIIEPDGYFRVDDVQPGTFQLYMEVYENEGQYAPPALLGKLVHRFTIPEIPGGQSDEPFDLGTLQVKPNIKINIGDLAPPIEAKTLDGKPVSLADFKGKYVLLHFWNALWNHGRTEISHIQALHKAFGNDDRLVILNLSFDPEIKWPYKYAATHDLKGIQAYREPDPALEDGLGYNLQDFPSAVLIGPDGRLLTGELKGPAIQQAVEKALGDQSR